MMTFVAVRRPIGCHRDGFFRSIEAASLVEAEHLAAMHFGTDCPKWSLRIYTDPYAGCVSSYCHALDEWLRAPDWDE